MQILYLDATTDSQTKFEANHMKNGKVTFFRLVKEEKEEEEEEEEEQEEEEEENYLDFKLSDHYDLKLEFEIKVSPEKGAGLRPASFLHL